MVFWCYHTQDRPELTPVAIQAGVLLARRLFAGASQKMNYNYIPTTVFTPVEYGCVGMAEETARQVLGKENVETYLSRYGALETAAGHPTVKRQVKSYEFHPKVGCALCCAVLCCEQLSEAENAFVVVGGRMRAVKVGKTRF